MKIDLIAAIICNFIGWSLFAKAKSELNELLGVLPFFGIKKNGDGVWESINCGEGMKTEKIVWRPNIPDKYDTFIFGDTKDPFYLRMTRTGFYVNDRLVTEDHEIYEQVKYFFEHGRVKGIKNEG